VKTFRVRFTVRRLMVVVAILAALLASFEAGRRWERMGSGVTIPATPYLADDVSAGPPAPSLPGVR
jgi:hypothetical protein